MLRPSYRRIKSMRESIAMARRPVRPMLRSEFDEMVAADPYYRGRWRYTSVALAEAAKLIERDNIRTALEVGAPVKPAIAGADVMDVVRHKDIDPNVRLTIHDARNIPWPFQDKQFGLFIALQVFEHLGTSQPAAFGEVRRVARHAIISLPIDWDMGDPTNIHHMIPEQRVLSWFAPTVPTRILEGNPGPKKRVIYVFEDLQA